MIIFIDPPFIYRSICYSTSCILDENTWKKKTVPGCHHLAPHEVLFMYFKEQTPEYIIALFSAH